MWSFSRLEGLVEAAYSFRLGRIKLCMEENLLVEALSLKDLRASILSFLLAKEVDKAVCASRLMRVYCFSFSRDGLPFSNPESPFYISDEDFCKD